MTASHFIDDNADCRLFDLPYSHGHTRRAPQIAELAVDGGSKESSKARAGLS